MAMQLPGGMAAPTKGKRGHGGTAAQAYNADTHTHVDSKGHTHKTHPGNKARIGPDTMIFAHGHPAMPFHRHAAQKTAVHKRMMPKGNPHPHALMARILPLAQAAPPPGALPEGPMPPAPQGLPGGMAALRGV